MTNYWQHRIGHLENVSYPLLDKNLLSVGFSDFADEEFLNSVTNKEECDQFFQKRWGFLYRYRNSLYHFVFEMKKGDIVVVPRKWGEFGVYRIKEDDVLLPKDIDVSSLRAWDGKKITHNKNNSRICLSDDLDILSDDLDIGFFRNVEPIIPNAIRSDYADAKLTSRMKARQTGLNIHDIKDSVDKAIEAYESKSPISIKSNLAKQFLTEIKEQLNPEKLEKLVKNYFEKAGASTVKIPAKNEQDKEGDADVVAEFESIKTIIYVQVKKHDGVTNELALEQIEAYKAQQEKNDDDYTRIAWVVSTADDFSSKCKERAAENNVLLVNGESFVEMLLEHNLSIFTDL